MSYPWGVTEIAKTTVQNQNIKTIIWHTVLSSVLREDQLYCRNLHKTTYITLFQNAFPVVHADCVTSVNLEIYNPISEHQAVLLSFSTFASAEFFVWTFSEQTNQYRALLWKTRTLWPPTCIIALFSSRKWAFKPLSKVQIIPFRFSGSSNAVSFTSYSIVGKKKIMPRPRYFSVKLREEDGAGG